jgi:hypothetical protein
MHLHTKENLDSRPVDGAARTRDDARYPERDVSASDDSKKLPMASRDDNIVIRTPALRSFTLPPC